MAGRFFDSDVIVGMVAGEERFRHLAMAEMATTRLNLMEVYYVLRRAGRPKEAATAFAKCLPNVVGFTDADLMAAMDWRSENFRKKTRELSYIDAVGYQVARSNGLTFTTGDRKFLGYPGVAVI